MLNSIFVNLPVANLQKSVAFFTSLGFRFNPQFTDEESTCMVISDTIYMMLLEEKKFESFLPKPRAPKEQSEAIFGFACESKEEVTRLSELAFSLGAKKVNDPQDLGFMFSWGFEDLDGHLWDLFWTDPAHLNN